MLHIATVHYVDPRWIDIQTRHLREHISVPYTTWASLEGIDPSYTTYFDRVFDLAWGHAPNGTRVWNGRRAGKRGGRGIGG